MSTKLDKSLDDILSTRKVAAKTAGRRGGRARRVPRAAAAPAPAGGVQKKTKATNGTTKGAVPSGPAGASGDSKIIVSNLVRHRGKLVMQYVSNVS